MSGNNMKADVPSNHPSGSEKKSFNWLFLRKQDSNLTDT